MSETVTVAMATFPPRIDGLVRVVQTLLPQCDRLCLYCNGYKERPKGLPNSPKLEIVLAGEGCAHKDLGSQGKLWWLGKYDGYYITADDDMFYPPDFTARLVAGVKRHGDKAVVTAHGSIFRVDADGRPVLKGGFLQDQRMLFAFDQAVSADRPVHSPGNACMACCPVALGMTAEDVIQGPLHSGDDPDIAIWTQKHGVPLIRIATPQRWIMSIPGIGMKEAMHRRQASRVLVNTKLRALEKWVLPMGAAAPAPTMPARIHVNPAARGQGRTTAVNGRIPTRPQAHSLRAPIPQRPRPTAAPVAATTKPLEPAGNIILLWATARPEVFRQTHAQWIANARYKHKIRTYVAVDTEEQRQQLADFRCIVTGNAVPGVCFPCYCLTRNIPTQPGDVIIVASDDFFPKPDWDCFIARQLNGVEAAVLVTNDGIQVTEPVLTLPIFTHAALQAMDGIVYHPAYTHLWCDVECFYVAAALGLLKDVRASTPVIFEHRHYTQGLRAKDGLDCKTSVTYGAGERLYRARAVLSVADRLRVDPAVEARAAAVCLDDALRPPRISILVCTTTQRAPLLQRLLRCLHPQCTKAVEILVAEDQGQMTTGAKRNALLDRAAGDYVCFIDDDDLVADDYVARLLAATAADPDCCSLQGVMTTDGRNPVRFVHSLAHKKWDTVVEDGVTTYVRCPNHLNLVKRGIAQTVRFPDITHGEDRDYSLRLMPLLHTEQAVEGVLYHYLYCTKAGHGA